MKSYSVATAKNIIELEGFVKKWKGLYDSLHLPVSYSPDWLLSWIHSYYEQNIEIDVSFVFEGRNLVAVIPFMMRKDHGRTVLKFLSDSCSDYLGIPCKLSAEDILPEIIVGVLSRIDFSIFNFSHLDSGEKSFVMLSQALSKIGLDFTVRIVDKSHYIDFGQSYASKFSIKTASRKFRYQINAISKLWRVEFRSLEKPREDEIHKLIEIHMGKWFSVNVIPQFADQRRIDFVHKAVNALSKIQQVRVFALYFNDNMVAYMLGFEKDQIYYDWNTAFDVRFGKYSPGKILLAKVIQFLQENGYQRLEFMSGSEKYKSEWASASRNILGIEGHNTFDIDKPPRTLISPKLNNLRSKRGFILDLHGIILKGRTPDVGAIHAIQNMQNKGIRIGILTNTSAFSVSDVRKSLSEVGLEFDDELIMTAAVATREYLVDQRIHSCLLIGGQPELPRLLTSSGIKVNTITEKMEAVVVGFSNELRASQVSEAYELLKLGRPFVCTDNDHLYADEGQNLPGTGWIVSAISSVARRNPLVIGKPSDYALRLLARRMGVELSDVVIVSDNMESDVASGKIAGITTCLQLGGVSDYEDVKRLSSSERPDFIIRSLDEIDRVFDVVSVRAPC